MMILQMDLFCFVMLFGHQIVFQKKFQCVELTVFYLLLLVTYLTERFD